MMYLCQAASSWIMKISPFMVHIVFLFNSDSAHNALQVTPQLYGAWISIRLVTVWLAAVMIEPSEYGPRVRYHYYPLPRPPNPQYFRGLNRIGGFLPGGTV